MKTGGAVNILIFLLPYDPIKKIENLKKKKKIWSGDMVDRYLPTKFGLDPRSDFRET